MANEVDLDIRSVMDHTRCLLDMAMLRRRMETAREQRYTLGWTKKNDGG